ncbi:MAG TPA: GNAT family N-acetyltransferase [Methanocorpusculum sp.]|nr:GNAT family N-acetyltransferase [Methanocorpusculum sp.]
MADYSLVRLSRKYDVSQFDCGIEDLNDFLKNDACKNQDDWISKTWLLYEGNQLLGYFTLIADTLHKGNIFLNDKIADYPYVKYPCIKLARLAVDSRFQHRGIGTELIIRFFEKAREVVECEGGRFITVDAKASACGFYEGFGFVQALSRRSEEIIPMYMDFYKYYSSL